MSAPGTNIPCPPSTNSLRTSIAKLFLAKPPSSPMLNPTALLSPKKALREFSIIGALLYYAHAVDNKLLATLSTLSSQQVTTKATNNAINQLLDYLATYPVDGTTYCASKT